MLRRIVEFALMEWFLDFTARDFRSLIGTPDVPQPHRHLPTISPGAIVNHRAFVTKAFARWLRKTNLSERDLFSAIAEMTAGLVDADLGGHLFKKRVASPGRGKRGSARVPGAGELVRELEIGNLLEIGHEAKSHTQ